MHTHVTADIWINDDTVVECQTSGSDNSPDQVSVYVGTEADSMLLTLVGSIDGLRRIGHAIAAEADAVEQRMFAAQQAPSGGF